MKQYYTEVLPKIVHTCLTKENYPIQLSPYARVFYDEWLLDPQSVKYNMLCADQLLSGSLDVCRLKQALNRYVADHLLLNSHIECIQGDPRWVKNHTISELDYSENQVSELVLLDYIRKPFDLYHGPLYRFKLIRLEKNIYRLIIIFHHLVMDGISLGDGLFNKLSAYYNDPCYVEELSLADQAQKLQTLQAELSQRAEENRSDWAEFWHRNLYDIEQLDLRFLKKNQSEQISLPDKLPNPLREITFHYDQTVKEKLDKITTRYQISPYFYGQCIFAIVLYHYTGQERFAICYPIAIREGLDFIYGGQVNLNLIPYEIKPQTRVSSILDQIKLFVETTLKSKMKSGYCPITDIITKNKKLLDVYFAQAYFRKQPFKFEGIEVLQSHSDLSVDGVTSECLLFEQEPVDDTLNYRVKYDSRTVDQSLLSQFINCYKKLFLEILEDLLQDRHQPISCYSLLNQIETNAVLTRYNQNQFQASHYQTIHQAFESIVSKYPYATAITYKNSKLTYHALNQKANQLAHYLQKNAELRPDDLVVLCLEKSDLAMIAILAVLKASAAYVPVADYPDSRIAYILEDTAPKLIVTDKQYQHKFIKYAPIVVIDDQDTQASISQACPENIAQGVTRSNLAYVIYTSGSTGKPKGVLQTHENVINLFTGTNQLYHFTNREVWVLFHSYVFDFSVWEIFGALLYGGELVIPEEAEIKDSSLFYQLCYREKITVLNQTPTAFHYFMKAALKLQDQYYLSHLKYIIFGGEALHFSDLAPWFKVYPNNQPLLVNMYGITETTVHTTYRRVQEEDICCKTANIGWPIPGRQVYVLSNHLKPLPRGAIGELYVSGGLARGYLNQPTKTEDCFLTNPFNNGGNPGHEFARLYKTGDLARMLPNGDLEFIGRKDSQVKVRGYRIELGEIEAALTSHPAIEMAVVIAYHEPSISKAGGHTHLVAYYVSPKKLSSNLLKDHVAKQLPEYMWPRAFLSLTDIPLTINGKLDQKALPKPDFKSEKRYKRPMTEPQKIVCQAFSSVLSIEKISIQDDFFELGGNSISAIALTLILQDSFEIKVADIFKLRTPKKIAENQWQGHHLLVSRLEKVKEFYQNRTTSPAILRSSQEKINQYKHTHQEFTLNPTLKKPISNVLLTGGTGYLGCNLLNQLLKNTNYNIYLLVRGDHEANAAERVEYKYQFYFQKSLKKHYAQRVFVINGNIEQENLGLSVALYHSLVNKIDSVIHAAALVKHYGDEVDFYSANVVSVRQLIEFTKLTQLKDFHYISTCSVAHFGHSPAAHRVFTENDLPDAADNWNNIYNKTKFLGEMETNKGRAHSINCNIYRVGNLAFISNSGQPQENLEENAFINWLQFLLRLGYIAPQCGLIQLSEVDLTAEAIVLLFDKKQLRNQTLHVFNPHLLTISEFFRKAGQPVIELSIAQFIDKIKMLLTTAEDNSYIAKFLLYQGWLEHDDLIDKVDINILQNQTESLLNQLGFQWPSISQATLRRYFSCLIDPIESNHGE